MLETHIENFKIAAAEALKSKCSRAQCGAIIVKNKKIIATGYNAPPLDKQEHSQCSAHYTENQNKPKSDRTCCIHAEWRAIIEALQSGGSLQGSTLYFTRIDSEGAIIFSGEPYCTVCSRLALDVGISFFALWHESGIKLYETAHYNKLSYDFHTKTPH